MNEKRCHKYTSAYEEALQRLFATVRVIRMFVLCPKAEAGPRLSTWKIYFQLPPSPPCPTRSRQNEATMTSKSACKHRQPGKRKTQDVAREVATPRLCSTTTASFFASAVCRGSGDSES